MRVLIAPDSFKGSLDATDAARAIARGFRSALPDAEVVTLPVADGGEGTVRSVISCLGGQVETTTVSDPFGRPVEAIWGWVPDAALAVIEVAAASGLPLLAGQEPDPLRASSSGTGQLMMAALERGARDFIIGLGGSATVDGGTGLLQALGVRFLDAEGRPLLACGGSLARIADIDLSGMSKGAGSIRIAAACDVTSALLGPAGCVRTFGPQKGAGEAEQAVLEAGLANYADVVQRVCGRDPSEAEGAGAAGGLGFGLAAVLGARLRSGFALIAELAELPRRVAEADLVVTGEGRLDAQSLCGKVPIGVARIAAAAGVPVVAFAGSIVGNPRTFADQGITLALPIVDAPMSLEQAMADADRLLEHAAARVAGAMALGRSVNSLTPACRRP